MSNLVVFHLQIFLLKIDKDSSCKVLPGINLSLSNQTIDGNECKMQLVGVICYEASNRNYNAVVRYINLNGVIQWIWLDSKMIFANTLETELMFWTNMKSYDNIEMVPPIHIRYLLENACLCIYSPCVDSGNHLSVDVNSSDEGQPTATHTTLNRNSSSDSAEQISTRLYENECEGEDPVQELAGILETNNGVGDNTPVESSLSNASINFL